MTAFPWCEEMIREQVDNPIPTESQTGVALGLFATGEIPRRTDYEDTGGPFFIDPECRHADLLIGKRKWEAEMEENEQNKIVSIRVLE